MMRFGRCVHTTKSIFRTPHQTQTAATRIFGYYGDDDDCNCTCSKFLLSIVSGIGLVIELVCFSVQYYVALVCFSYVCVCVCRVGSQVTRCLLFESCQLIPAAALAAAVTYKFASHKPQIIVVVPDEREDDPDSAKGALYYLSDVFWLAAVVLNYVCCECLQRCRGKRLQIAVLYTTYIQVMYTLSE